MSSTLLIAIDGPSSSGKGTIAKKIAYHFSIPYLNTGSLYRALALLAFEAKLDLEKDINKIVKLVDNIDLNDLESLKLHNEDIAKKASLIAKNEKIRKGLFDLQRNFIKKGIKNNNGAVLDGRDIASVICPEANYKFFITASTKVRADRRFKQMQENGQKCDYDDIFNKLQLRDKQDKNRPNSPLILAKGAIKIDTSDLNIDQVFNKILGYIK